MQNNRKGARLAQMLDVSLGDPATGQLLTYDRAQGKWTAQAGAAGNLAGLSDVALSSPADADRLVYDAASGKWKNAARTTQIAKLDDVPDVNAPAPVSGQVLSFNGTYWVPINRVVAIGDLSNVLINGTPAVREVLTYNNGKWTNLAQPLPELENNEDVLLSSSSVTSTTMANINAGFTLTVVTGGVWIVSVNLNLLSTSAVTFTGALRWGSNTTAGPDVGLAANVNTPASWTYRVGGIAAGGALTPQGKVSAGSVTVSNGSLVAFRIGS